MKNFLIICIIAEAFFIGLHFEELKQVWTQKDTESIMRIQYCNDVHNGNDNKIKICLMSKVPQ